MITLLKAIVNVIVLGKCSTLMLADKSIDFFMIAVMLTNC